MEPIDFLRALRQRWLLIVAAVAVALGAAWVTTPDTPQVGPTVAYYTATASLLQDPGAEIPLSYVEIFVTRGDVPKVVAEQIGYQGDPAILANGVSVSVDDSSGIMSITATSPDGDEAAQVANAFAEVTVDTVDDIALEDQQRRVTELQSQLKETKEQLDEATAARENRPNDPVLEAQQSVLSQQYSATLAQLYAALGATGVGADVRVLQEATPIPVVSGGFAPPSSRSGRLLLAGGLGLALGILLALMVARLDTRLRHRTEIEQAYGLPVVVEVPYVAGRVRRTEPVAALSSPVSPSAEAYRSLRSAMALLTSRPLAETGATPTSWEDSAEQREPQVVLVTSTRAGEGKSTTAANLAVTLAETGKRVLVLDADFRNPTLHKLLDVAEGPGLAEVLANGDMRDLSAMVRPTAASRVSMLTAGDATDFRGVLPSRIKDLVGHARGLGDVVVIDVAPLLAGNDALDFMPFIDSCIVVCRPGRVTRDQADRAQGLLRRIATPVLGLVLVAVRPGAAGGMHLSGYGYGYGSRRTSSLGRRRAPRARSKKG